MRRDRGRHADRDALRSVGEQIREGGRQNHRLLRNAVVVRPEIDGIFVDAVEQKPRDFRKPRFGIAVGCGIIAVDIAEIALAVDQRIARGKILRQPNQCIVNRLVAVRMEIAHHVADDFRRLLEGRAWIEPQEPHAVENAAVHRFEPIARVGQRPVHDGRQRIGEVALLERLAQRDFGNPARFRGNHFLVHGEEALARLTGRNKGRTAEDLGLLGARASAVTKCPRASGNASPRGAKAWRSRKKPVSAKASARSGAVSGSPSLVQKSGQPQ